MVFNTTKHVKLPFSNAILQPHSKKVIPRGEGVGAVLLRTGGPGAGSSYMDIDDYIHTTGINPYTRAGTKKGTGLKSLSSKLEKLIVVPEGHKRKNITMSF